MEVDGVLYVWVTNYPIKKRQELLKKNKDFRVGMPKVSLDVTANELMNMGVEGFYLPKKSDDDK
jgi:hypothetical protein